MARIRIWEKKRGSRRTGSKLIASIGEAFFFAALFVSGVLGLAAMITSQVLDPQPAFFELGFGSWLLMLVLASILLAGATGFMYTVVLAGASAERRSALVRRATRIDITGERDVPTRRYPNVPLGLNLTNSPGTHLKYRLPSLHSPAWSLAAAAISFLLSAAVVSVVSVVAVQSYQAGSTPWTLTVLLIPFSSVTAWTVYYFIRQMALHTGIGATIVEVSDHPLRPGRTYRVYLRQGGRLQLKSLQFSLACEEEATYHQGTDIRTDAAIVFNHALLNQQNLRLERSTPLEHATEVTIPGGAMHSFQASHNAIHWKLVVRGSVESWPPFERSFPVIVCPPEPRGEALHGSFD